MTEKIRNESIPLQLVNKMHRDFEIEATRYRGSLIKQIPNCCITNMQELFRSAFVWQGNIPSLWIG